MSERSAYVVRYRCPNGCYQLIRPLASVGTTGDSPKEVADRCPVCFQQLRVQMGIDPGFAAIGGDDD